MISLGGDNTFLKSQSSIKNSFDTAIIGINSHAKHSKAKLCSTTIDIDSYKDQVSQILSNIKKVGTPQEREYVEYFNRSRIYCEM